jgi:hypothetical protein
LDVEYFLEVMMQEDILEDPENVGMIVEVATSLLEPRKNPDVKRCARSEVKRVARTMS